MGCGLSNETKKTKEPTETKKKDNPDENLYSRQMAVYGAETQGKLMKMKVFIYGLQGVGIEVAKNLVLAGPSQVVIYDDNICKSVDQGVNFYIQEKHVKNNSTRAEASAEQLQQLNPYCQVTILKGEIDTQVLSSYNVVVFTDYFNKEKLIEFNNFCREKGIGFIYTANLGLYGCAFVDFGQKHKVFDNNGEDPKHSIVVSITQDKEGLVTTHEDKRHGLVDGDHVTFKEVQGMTEVNDQVYKVTVKSPFTFTIAQDTSKFKAYQREGIVQQVKVCEEIQFNSLQQSLNNPIAPGKDCLEMCDFEKIGRPEQLHIILNGIFEFCKHNNGQLPQLLNQDHSKQLKEIVHKLLESNKADASNKFKVEEIPDELIQNVSLYARAHISPVASFWGGVVAQEIVKFTGKFTPLRQWLHHEVFECLPDSQVTREVVDSQNGHYVAIFGKEFQESLSKIKLFLVGAGALGCEYLKMFALMGMSTGQSGLVSVTDDDNIETSNLNRQFLFRKENVGKSKSETACQVAKNMNNRLNVKSYKLRVAPENEQFFNDDFWVSLDFVVNAVDNVKARLFVDAQCVWFEKPLFESGTLGTKCNSQIVIPKLTQSYGDSADPPEESIPLCTLKNFPHQIEHTIQWARDYFEGIMVEGPNELSQFIKNPQEYLSKMQRENEGKSGILRAKLEILQKLAIAFNGGTYQNCVTLSRELFQEMFTNQIAQLLHSFPLDHKTEEGQPFWSGPKRPPQIIYFDENDEEHINFIQSSANIFAYLFGLKYNTNREEIKKMAKSVHVREFKPGNVKISTNQNDNTQNVAEDDEQICTKIADELLKLKISSSKKINTTEFEKDDPTNYHIDYVSAIANLRARNYKITEVDKFKVKLIAGKIIPALATTTAMVVGAVGLEIIKYILKKPITQIKNSFMNLALPMWLFSEPLPPMKHKDKDYDEILLGPVKAIPPGFTNWDKIDVVGPLTVQGLLDYFSQQYQVKLSIISVAKICIYNSYAGDSERLTQDIAALYEKLNKAPISQFKKFLEITASGETLNDGVDVNMPIVKYKYK
ncbi:ubiquitin-activating enzyme E1 (macronuclear) [Tetrahymena thermophila SB210]|uniref:E1 ubiquitin-activating enzyme n=1 Tax=Tetrahymena thermophila (strain SB210) TaxID=312017 RepID=I7M407_TETTS|nr:ubiquitin-activating enzyme E1 [Tetrahymena thermophila SB210]EAS04669.2 ubiquitin-activating enzyme E1 [Tetrahymena thermophila SB210]|eukprot:XP_001024914.2 ubiquitin-activating enzyme E1 [Tetrahymena thermophila SB210]